MCTVHLVSFQSLSSSSQAARSGHGVTKRTNPPRTLHLTSPSRISLSGRCGQMFLFLYLMAMCFIFLLWSSHCFHLCFAQAKLTNMDQMIALYSHQGRGWAFVSSQWGISPRGQRLNRRPKGSFFEQQLMGESNGIDVSFVLNQCTASNFSVPKRFLDLKERREKKKPRYVGAFWSISISGMHGFQHAIMQ